MVLSVQTNHAGGEYELEREIGKRKRQNTDYSEELCRTKRQTDRKTEVVDMKRDR